MRERRTMGTAEQLARMSEIKDTTDRQRSQKSNYYLTLKPYHTREEKLPTILLGGKPCIFKSTHDNLLMHMSSDLIKRLTPFLLPVG